MPEVKPWDSYALAVETKGHLPNVHGPKRTRMSDGRRRKKTKDAIFFIYPLDKQQVDEAQPPQAAVTSTRCNRDPNLASSKTVELVVG